MRASSLASAHLQADVSWQRRGAAELSSRSSSGLHACVLAQQQHKLRSQRPSPRLDGERRLFATTTAAAQQSRNSSAGKKRGVDSKSKPATGAAGQLLLNKLAAGPQEVALKEAQQALSAVKGSPDTLWALYSALRGRVAGGLDPRSYGLVISGVAKGSGWDALKRAKEVHADFLQAGFPNDAFVLSGLISAYGRAGDSDGAQAAWDEAAAAGVPLDTRAMNSLLSAVARSGGLAATRAAFERARAACGGLAPDGNTFAALVTAAVREGEHTEALRLVEEGSAAGFETDRALASAALNACAAAGDASRAHRIFDKCKDAGVPMDLVSVNSVVTACARAADGDGAWLAFEKGRSLGLKPERDERVVSSVLCAFSRTKEVPRAESFFRSVARAWPGNKPPEVCYLLLRDVAAAAGDEQAAKRISQLMQDELPKRINSGKGGASAAAAAAAAESRRRAGIATPAADSPPSDEAPQGASGDAGAPLPGAADGAGSDGDEEGAEEDDEAGDDEAAAPSEDGLPGPRRRRRVVALARFTADGVQYSTENGELEAESLPEGSRARELLAGAGPALLRAVREKGSAYEPVLSGVLLMAGGDDAKRAALACHAEKKALGALILRVKDKAPKVRVNIRMCVDCHAAFEAASAVLASPIVCVDGAAGHTHKFENGVCSCGGKWR